MNDNIDNIGFGNRVQGGSCGPWPLSGRTRVFCIIGSPVSHSMSPAMHNTAFECLALDAVYVPFEVTDLSRAVRGLVALGIQGASVTIPFKEAIMDLVDEVDETAAKIGAVNTLVIEKGTIKGTNTDWIGAQRCLEDLLPIRGHRFVVLGAGGAARAVLYAVTRQGGEAVVVNRSVKKGRALADEFGVTFFPFTAIDRINADCLVNTTPVGMHPYEHESPVSDTVVRRYEAVVDVIYNPLKTLLLAQAEAAGCGVASGVEMFVYQGVKQFELWTGQKAPVERMKEAVYNRLLNQ
ncbi:MAG: shikimate dehydrogenase [Deltaproteobacteria bacterium]|nr:shikimate dehydrogenase [Deltaproteobacteria bacterium]